jgi:hypothetical protein
LAQFKLDDGTTFLVEVDEPSSSAVERVSIDSGEMVYRAKQTLEEALEQVKPVASAVITKLQSGLTTSADEVDVKQNLASTI